ncbi:MAG: 4-hydroxybenzoate octaprenyltransferase [Candidatus Poribacteria bacterium]|nr:MAG: 4-hydroxybenzoate octaprenyltransferase [Candidatus Poribacteria bacterium]
MGVVRQVRIILEMIKFEHTIFALPFAVMSAFFAAGGWPEPRSLFWILVAMIGARSAAMAFNRLVDAEFDAENPRTARRAIPAGLISPRAVALFTAISSGLLVVAAWQLNPLALALSPLALVIVLGYSFTKRFTTLSHLWLGFSLSVAPMGAWIAIRGRFEPFPFLLVGIVLLWVAGFDIIYACQDVEFDRRKGLYSVPARLGVGPALALSAAFHAAMYALLWALPRFARGYGIHLGALYTAGVAVVGVLLLYEHLIVRPSDLSRVNAAFFTMNGLVSLLLMLVCVADVLW